MAKKSRKAQAEAPVLSNEEIIKLHEDVTKAYNISRDKSVNRVLERVLVTLTSATLAIQE